LDNTAGVDLHRELNHLAPHPLAEDLLLHLVSMFKELLDNIVAKHVLHELDSVRLDLAEHLVLLVAVSSLKLRLDEPRAVLITAELDDIAVDVLEFVSLAGLAVRGEVFQNRTANASHSIVLGSLLDWSYVA
jgi:hypothetical protein